MRITCIQMNMQFCRPEENFLRVSELVETAMQDAPDVILLPETWNTGFYPKENPELLADLRGQRTKALLGALAAKHRVNIVAGSVTDLRERQLYNTCYVFDREGQCIAAYDKTHLFSPMEEEQVYTPGCRLCRFVLDEVSCGVIICYDLRFPELARKLCLEGVDILFLPSQWPAPRTRQLHTLAAARAIENQVFLACCNSCGTAGDTAFGGRSAIFDPWGNVLAEAETEEAHITAVCDPADLEKIRSAIPIYRDRRPELY